MIATAISSGNRIVAAVLGRALDAEEPASIHREVREWFLSRDKNEGAFE
jgi:hypothetical protein